MKGLILNIRRATRRIDNLASGLILGNNDGLIADSVPPSDFPPGDVLPQTSSPRLRYILYSTSTAPLSTTKTLDLEPSLGATGRAVSIAVMAILLLFFCLGVASYFCWRKRTRFYKEKGQVLQIWNNHHSRKQPLSPTPTCSIISEPVNSKRPKSELGNEVTTSIIAADTRGAQGFKMKMTASLPTWRFSRPSNIPSRPVTVPPTAVTANRHVAIANSVPPALPTVAAAAPSTLALAGYVPDPVIGAYMDNARRQYAAHLAKTGNYPSHYLNPIAAPNLLAPTVPTLSSQQEDSDVSSASSTTFGSVNKKPKSVWGRTSDLFSNRHFGPTGRSYVSKNHVSRFFQENARPHSYPLYAPRYDIDEDGDEDDREEEGADGTDHDEGDNRYRRVVLDKEGRAYRHPNDFMVRTPMTVQEAQAAAARMLALGEERKRKMGGISLPDVTIPLLPPPSPAAAVVTQTARP